MHLRKHLQRILSLGALIAVLGTSGCGEYLVRTFIGSPPKEGAQEAPGRMVGRRFESPRVSYEIGPLPENWVFQEGDRGDAAYYSKEHKALISVRSVCARYSEARLQNLARDLLWGFTDRQIVREKVIEFADHRIERLQEQLCHRHGFKPVEHCMGIKGICRECQRVSKNGR